jgi:HD-like signal output (HDOD) protein
MTRILFVDDEPRVLEALQNLLRRHRRGWDMVFAEGGQRGLDLLTEDHFDIVVSDIRMPKVDGATVLQAAQKLQPEAVRIVLSGFMEQETALRAVPVAHQFLAKPCDPMSLEVTLDRACQLHELIRDPELRRILGQVQKLPSIPSTWARLKTVMDSPTSNASQVATVLRQDVAVCARILQLVNSPFFGPARRITALEDAVTYLGNNLIKNLVFSLELFQSAPASSAFSLEEMRVHTLLTASIARRVVPERRLADEAFFAAMLHDVGLLVLATLPEVPQDPTLHLRIGAYLMSLWGMDTPLIHAVQDHHNPSARASGRFTTTTAVHVADVLALRHRPFAACPPTDFDWEYLELVGITDRVASWEQVAEEAVLSLASLS